MAPEIYALQEFQDKLRSKEPPPYWSGVDVWSAGVILFILFAGHPPFHHKNHNKLAKLVMKGKYTMQEEIWKPVSDNAKQVLKQMLTVDPAKRPSASELLQCPWFQASHEDLSQNLLSPGRQKSFEVFHSEDKRSRRARSLVQVAAAANMMQQARLSKRGSKMKLLHSHSPNSFEFEAWDGVAVGDLQAEGESPPQAPAAVEAQNEEAQVPGAAKVSPVVS